VPPRPRPGRGQFVRVTAEGIGISTVRDRRKPYTYIERLGGVVWALPIRELIAKQEIPLNFEVTNPLIMQRDFTGRRPVEIKSPPRSIFVSVRVEAPRGVRAPVFVIRQDRQVLEAGESTKATILVAPAPAGGTGAVQTGIVTIVAGDKDDDVIPPNEIKMTGPIFHGSNGPVPIVLAIQELQLRGTEGADPPIDLVLNVRYGPSEPAGKFPPTTFRIAAKNLSRGTAIRRLVVRWWAVVPATSGARGATSRPARRRN
jgi:hypothetical protein